MEFSLFASSLLAIGFLILVIRYSRLHKKGTHTQTIKKIKTMDIILIVVGSFLFFFTITMIVMFFLCGSIPDTLVTCVFGACAGECGIMGWIKTTKDKKTAREWQLEDEKRNSFKVQ